MGTINVLDVAKKYNFIKSITVVTTDKVYLNLEKIPFKEGDSLGGHDIYSGSKAAAEIVAQSYKKSFLKKLIAK